MTLPLVNKPRLLSPAELAQPQLVLENFFDSFHLYEVQDLLEQLQTQMMYSLRHQPHRQQETWLFFFEKLERLVEAGWVMRG